MRFITSGILSVNRRFRRVHPSKFFPRVLLLIIVALLVVAEAPGAVIVVNEGRSWTSDASGTACTASPTASFDFVEFGIAAPPAGEGSVEIQTGTDGNSYALFQNFDFDGVRLDSITELTYWTYVQQTNVSPSRPRQAPLLSFRIDTGNDGANDETIFFEPAYQEFQYANVIGFPDQGEIEEDVWQEWDALVGGWWSNGGSCGATEGSGTKTLATILGCFPNATIRNEGTASSLGGTSGGVRLFGGCGGSAWPNFIGNFDFLTITAAGTTTSFDFEGLPFPIPALSELGLLALLIMMAAVGVVALKFR